MSELATIPVPPNWTQTTIGIVIEDRIPQTGPSGDETFTYIDIGAIDNSTKRIVDPKELSVAEAPSRARQVLATDDILVSMTRPNLNAVAKVPVQLNGAIGSTGFDVLRTTLIDPSWLYYTVQSNAFIRAMCQVVQGALYPAVRPRDIRSYRLPIPPVTEQRRIVAKIEELFSDLDAGVAALERAKANLKRYRAAVLKAAVEGKLTEAWRAEHPNTEPASKLLERILVERRQKWEADQLAKFAAKGKQPAKNWKAKYVEPPPPDTSELPELPEGWCWASVAQTSDVQGGVQKQPKRVARKNAFPFLRVANVHRDRLDLSDVHQIELFGDELDRLRLQPDDLLVVEGNGSKTEIGRSAIWNGEIEDCVHQNHIIRVRFLTGSSRYLNAYWNSPLGNGKVMEQAASTSGLYTLSVAKVCSFPVPLPPLAEQQRIVSEVAEKLSQIDAAETTIAHGLRRAARVRQSILKQAFEGKLVPQDPADEPAGVLLERLRAGRASPASKASMRKRRIKS